MGRLVTRAREAALLDRICQQTSQTRRRLWDEYFSNELTPVQKVLRRRRFARALRFYLEKAHRHSLHDAAYQRLSREVDGLLASNWAPVAEAGEDLGFVFCPEHMNAPVELDFDGSTRVFLFGPRGLPDSSEAARDGASEGEGAMPDDNGSGSGPGERPSPEAHAEPAGGPSGDALAVAEEKSAPPGGPFDVLLGEDVASGESVEWRVGLRGNPHLMIVGQPGMGKTTSILNSCLQMSRAGIVPIVFSYHPDLEQGLERHLGALVTVDVDSGLGFNPMRVIGRGARAWLDNVGMLRDILAAIFPVLGDRQTNEIRGALKQSYADLGHGKDGCTPDEVPAFERFYEILSAQEKPNPGVMQRLEELNDYGLFRSTTERPSLLSTDSPVVVRLHASPNEAVQGFLACFTLFSIYQAMMLRGVQDRITHVVVFDEAHRASRLKLLPTMAKECRKFGLSLIVASQEAKDFDGSLLSAIGNYLVLRVADADAATLSRNVPGAADAAKLAGRLKLLDPHMAMMFRLGCPPMRVGLLPPPT